MTTSKVTPFRPGNKSPPHEQYYNFDKKPGNKSLDHEHNYLLEKSTNSNNEIYKEYVDINKEYYRNRKISIPRENKLTDRHARTF